MKSNYRRMLRGMKARQEGSKDPSAKVWHLYILRCGDGSFYTGVTTDVERRVHEHQDGKASHYTRTHLPVELVHREACGHRSQALARECAVKSLSRKKKEDLVARAGAGPASAETGKAMPAVKLVKKRKR
jgi:putative endonuclease